MKIQIAGLVVGFALLACGGGTGASGTSGGGASGSGSAASSTGTTGASSSSASSSSSSSTGTTASPATGGSTGAATTSGGTGGACTACTPANPCDLGCAQAGGGVDRNAANAARTGASCDAGAVCEGQLCLVGSGPQVPNYQGGVLATPNVVFMAYQIDPNETVLENWATWFVTDGFLPSYLGQYGIQNGTVDLVTLPDVLANLPSQYAIEQYIANEMATNPNVPAYAPNNVYMLMMPYAWSDTASFCDQQGGYHSVLQDDEGDDVVYGVVADCGQGATSAHLLEDEVALSHEIVESSTDPLIDSWAFLDPDNAWSYIGGEIGDMCESNSSFYLDDAGYAAQLFWSNAAAAASQPPCQPWPADQVYVTVLGNATLVPAAPGATVQIPITGWASGPTQPWDIAIEDSFYGVDFSTSPQLASGTIGPGQQVMAELSVPAAPTGQPAVGGGVGATYILTQAGSAMDGWLMVGVVATCQTTGDCASETSACQVDAGVGMCVNELCAPDAGAFSICSAQGTNDGVCVPADFGSGPVQLCNQAGSIPLDGGNCQAGRLEGGGASDYCVPAAGCVAGQTTAVCAAFCVSPDGGLQGSCPIGQDCISFTSQYFGNCQADCSTGQTCPPNQTCYSLGGNVSSCFPN